MRFGSTGRPGTAAAFTIAIVSHLSCVSQRTLELDAQELAEVRSVETDYAAAWAANDRSAVLALLDSGAVLLPSGQQPVVGLDQITAFWWPSTGPATTITSYETTIDAVDGSGSLAFVRGHGALSFTWQDASGEPVSRTSRNAFLMVVRKGQDGQWRILQRMWGNLPSETS